MEGERGNGREGGGECGGIGGYGVVLAGEGERGCGKRRGRGSSAA